MLQINLKSVSVTGTEILKNIELNIEKGSITILTGRNGSGKSTIARSILGFPDLKIEGRINIDGEDISKEPMHQRARKGIFLSHQTPTQINGVKIMSFLRSMYLQMDYIPRKNDLVTFRKEIAYYAEKLGLSTDITSRELNVGLSGGESKKLEFLQILLLKPKYAILDELDSGLDTESRKLIFKEVEELAAAGTGFLLITHRENIGVEIHTDNIFWLNDGNLTNE